MATTPEVCGDCTHCILVNGHHECHANPPIRDSRHEAETPYGWFFPRVDPTNRDVCCLATTKS